MYEDEPAGQGLRRARRGRLRRRIRSGGRSSAAPRSSRDTPVDADRARSTRARYRPGNVVVAAAGSVDHERWSSWSSGAAPDGRRRPAASPTAARRRAPARALRAQGHRAGTTSASARPGSPRDDERRFALRVLDSIFGGTSSSRLFQEVREKRGLAYAVYSFPRATPDTGQVGLYLGTRADNLAEALRVVAAELERLRDEPATAEELDALQGERQGPRRALAGVDVHAHEPPGLARSSAGVPRARRSTR